MKIRRRSKPSPSLSPPPFHPTESVPAATVVTTEQLSVEHPTFEVTQTGLSTQPSMPPPFRPKPFKLPFKPFEILLIGLGCLLLIGSLGRLIFKPTNLDGAVKVGKLGTHQGSVQRQMQNSTEFNRIQKEADLYNHDTVMTSSSGGATLLLDDGATIELGPDTLIKLQFETGQIEVFAGVATGKGGKVGVKRMNSNAADEKAFAAPASDQIQQTQPPLGATLSLQDLREPLQRAVKLEWTTKVNDAVLELVLRKLPSSPAEAPEEIIRRVISARGGLGSALVSIRKPGAYEWELNDARGKSLKGGTVRSEFTLASEFQAIEVLPPTAAQDVTLRWKPLPSVSRYWVRVSGSRSMKKPALEREVRDEQFSFSLQTVPLRKVYYQISSPLSGGFVATSRIQPFAFSFVAPALVFPQDKAVFSRRALAANDNSILMTWQKTELTQSYEIQISSEPQFRKPLLSKPLTDNFYLLKSKQMGRFWWRVRSLAKDGNSPYSSAAELTITP